MAITTSKIGTYTTLLSLSGETSSDGFVTALDAAIVTGGWSQHDISNPLYRVYKSLNIDGQTHKYAAVSIDIGRQRFWLTSWESWNADTHVGTNEVFTHHGGYWQPYTFNWCDVVVFANPRWLGFQTYIRNIAAPHPVFVLETTRDHAQDTPELGIPCWGWMTPATTSQTLPYGTSGSSSGAAVFSSPRSVSGLTGSTNAKRSFIANAFDRAGAPAYMLPVINQSFGNGLSTVLANTSSNAWDESSVYTSTLKVGVDYSVLQGRLVGMKGTKVNNAKLMSRITVPVDSNFMFDPQGNNTEHWAIPITTDRPNASLNNVDSTPLTSIVNAVWDGNNIFALDSQGRCYRYDILTRDATLVTTLSTNLIGGMAFDGRYVYLGNGTTIAKWDTTDDTFVYSGAVTGATQARLCFDGTHIWSLDSSGSSGKHNARKYDTNLSLLATVAVVTSSTAAKGADISCDNSGNIAVLSYESSTYASRLAKIDANSATVTGYMSLNNGHSSSGGSIYWTGAKGVFEVSAGYQNYVSGTGYTTNTINNYTVDCNQASPAPVSDRSTNSIAQAGTSLTFHLPTTSAPSNYCAFPRYGRALHWVANSRLCSVDYDGVYSDTTTPVSATSMLPYGLIHFGTHVLCSGNPTTVLIATNDMKASYLNAQLLLPK